MKTVQEILKLAQGEMGDQCKACPVCDGRACRNRMPGPGAKGIGDVAIRNYDAWQKIRVNMDTLVPKGPVDTTLRVFGREFRFPLFVGPIGAVTLHYGKKLGDTEYNDILVPAAKKAGVLAFTGDGVDPTIMQRATRTIAAAGGCGIPTVKPWDTATVREKMVRAKSAGAPAIAMDVDAAGLPFLKNLNPPAGPTSVEELTEIVASAGVPFIVKGVMSAKVALKAKQAGAAAVIVSNHGGRVLDQCPATAEVLAEIVDAVGDSMKVFVDGGIRSGVDIFKALALGADGVLVCRPFAPMIYGAGEEGVLALIEKFGAELADTMLMCGARSLADISRDMVRI